jgi:energy-coupling factor transport system permease protein
VSAGHATILLVALAAVTLLADRWTVVAAVAAVLLAVVLARAPRGRALVYLSGTAFSALSVLIISPLAQARGSHPIWSGPIVPVFGPLDVTREEVALAAVYALRFAALGLAVAAYALVVDHDRLVQGAGFARRSVLAVVLATRLLPTLERDAAGFVEALRGRGVAVGGLHGRARLVSPLLAGSLERALNLAESMEARGYGRRGRTRPPQPGWSVVDRAVVLVAVPLALVAALWL